MYNAHTECFDAAIEGVPGGARFSPGKSSAYYMYLISPQSRRTRTNEGLH